MSEVFRSFQGEGPSLGRPAVFLRLRRCNLACIWCDTKYTWDPGDPGFWGYETLTPEEVLCRVGRLAQLGDLLVVTGGEPLLWKRELRELLQRWTNSRVEIETNGTISPAGVDFENVHFNVSPKLSSSHSINLHRIRPEVLREFVKSHRAVFKFVVSSLSDLPEIEDLVAEHKLHPVYLMPEGVARERVLETMSWLGPECVARGWRLTSRLHILVYGDRRGT